MKERAQHMIEYVVVLTAVVAAIIVAARIVIPGRVRNYLKTAGELVENSVP